jgi:hypothetical protein
MILQILPKITKKNVIKPVILPKQKLPVFLQHWREHVSGKCKITYFAIKNLIQDSKESRGCQIVKENNIIFTLEG